MIQEKVAACFIVTLCNFKPEVLAKLKSILLENDYASIVAEEILDYNANLLDSKVLEPMKKADLIIVILTPKDDGKKEDLLRLLNEIQQYIKHEDKLKGLEIAKQNISERNKNAQEKLLSNINSY